MSATAPPPLPLPLCRHPSHRRFVGRKQANKAKARIVTIAGQLRGKGISVDMAYGNRGVKGAMKAADRSGARYALVLGDKELAAGTVVLKELATGEQREVPLTEVLAQVEAGIAK